MELSADVLLRAYVLGIFPMAPHRDSAHVQWVDPPDRGILPIDGFHISRSLRKALRKGDYQIALNRDFGACVRYCADRDETWINGALFDTYTQLNGSGHAHSLEVWAGDEMIGGVFGISLGAAFIGESMFSRRTNGSKIALAWLMARLRYGGFQLFDAQFVTDHLATLGAVQIPRDAYQQRLRIALLGNGSIDRMPPDISAAEVF